MQLSVVIPCLNESDTIAKCVEDAVSTITKLRIEGDVIVVDNGSTDGSPALARSLFFPTESPRIRGELSKDEFGPFKGIDTQRPR